MASQNTSGSASAIPEYSNTDDEEENDLKMTL